MNSEIGVGLNWGNIIVYGGLLILILVGATMYFRSKSKR